jgi:hypothetical protein
MANLHMVYLSNSYIRQWGRCRLLARILKESVQFWYDTSSVRGGVEKTFLWKPLKFMLLHISICSKLVRHFSNTLNLCRYTSLLKGKWQYKFLFSHLKELLKLFNNFLYRFFISCLLLEIFSLEVMRCPPSWINF